jgi:predicted nucleic acid-binding protein
VGRLATVLEAHGVVALDTNCFIYYLEGGPWAVELKQDLFRPLEEGRFRAVTSALTLAEILVRPKSLGREDVCEEYKALLCSYPSLGNCPFHRGSRRHPRRDPGQVPHSERRMRFSHCL